MKLAYWMYVGPAHIGTLRIASSFQNIHAIMHAPLGDDYFNVMRSMLERKKNFTPVTTSVVDRHVLTRGSQEKVIYNITRKDKEEKPDLIVLTPTCTSSILQEDLQNFVNRASFEANCDVLLADVNHYRVNEFQAADKTLLQIVSFYLEKEKKKPAVLKKTLKPSVNIIGMSSLGFHNNHDLAELKKLFQDLNININLIVPEQTKVTELKNLPSAWINIIPYQEIGLMTAEYLEENYGIPFIDISPMGLENLKLFIERLQTVLKINYSFDADFTAYIEKQTYSTSEAAWFSQSIDCQNLLGKSAVVFGDATHAAAITNILKKQFKINILWAGTYCKDKKEWFENQVKESTDKILITDDHELVNKWIQKTEPTAIFGTQMERHVGKRLNIPCGVISAPVHIQNFPLSYRPFLGYEGANQIADLIYNSFTLGMEDHLLEIFGGHDTKEFLLSETNKQFEWSKEALNELKHIPGFVRKKVQSKTEDYAKQHKISFITLEVMYAAKEATIS